MVWLAERTQSTKGQNVTKNASQSYMLLPAGEDGGHNHVLKLLIKNLD